jgi:folate-binding protein YgfZ
MTDLKTQFDAILTGAAFAPIPDRGFLRVTGPDATRWLNGMVTGNVKALAAGEGCYNFLLNAQGRILGDCMIYPEPGEEPTFLIETSTDQVEAIYQHLDKFIIMDDVELLRADTAGSLQKPREKETFELTPEEHEAFRIYAGTPKYGVDIRNTDAAKDLPQETAQNHALSFNKGCYVGQEIVERIHSRGQVHRTFLKMTLTGSMPEVFPAPLEANGKAVGEITSAAQVGDVIYALGYARREALESGAELKYSGGTASPRSGK